MLKKITLFFIALLFIPLSAKEFDARHIPVQDGGRIKPLDTFARNQLLAIYGKRSLKSENQTAINWMLKLLSDPKVGFNQKVFNLRNPQVVQSLGLEWDNKHKYSYHEIVLPALLS